MHKRQVLENIHECSVLCDDPKRPEITCVRIHVCAHMCTRTSARIHVYVYMCTHTCVRIHPTRPLFICVRIYVYPGWSLKKVASPLSYLTTNQ